MSIPSCPVHNVVLVCPRCLASARGRMAAGRAKPSLQKPKREKKEKDPAAFSNKDCLAVFRLQPEAILDAATVQLTAISAYPEKRANVSAKRLRRLINFLYERGQLERVSEGKYRLAPRQKEEQNGEAKDEKRRGGKA